MALFCNPLPKYRKYSNKKWGRDKDKELNKAAVTQAVGVPWSGYAAVLLHPQYDLKFLEETF